MRVGFFDSGIGGLTVLNEALKENYQADYIYYADQANVPYGNKSKEEVRELLMEAADFLVSKDINALVVACNTATSAGIEDLRQKFSFPVIGMEPAVKTGLLKDQNKKVLVMATALTLKEDKFKSLLNQTGGQERVLALPMPKLVDWAEEMDFSSSRVEAYLEDSLQGINFDDYSSLVLGCTHFIYYRPLLEKLLPAGVEIVDGNKGTIKNLFKKLEGLAPAGLPSEESRQIEFFSSDKSQDAKKMKDYLDYLKNEKI